MTVVVGRCLWCGTSLVQALKGRDRKFCTGDCRKKWREEQERDE